MRLRDTESTKRDTVSTKRDTVSANSNGPGKALTLLSHSPRADHDLHVGSRSRHRNFEPFCAAASAASVNAIELRSILTRIANGSDALTTVGGDSVSQGSSDSGF